MGINKIMLNALSNQWALTDDFQFQFSNAKYPFNVNSPLRPAELMAVSVMNVDLPQFSGNVQTVLQGGEWRVYAGKFQPFNLTVSFRDIHGLGIKNYFIKIWADQQTAYFDEIKSGIIISMNQQVIFQSDYCLINNISQTQLDNSNSQIAEFAVEFITPYFSNSQINMFGKTVATQTNTTTSTMNINQIFGSLTNVLF